MWSAQPRENREHVSRRIVEFCAFRGTSDDALYSARQVVGGPSLNPKPKPLAEQPGWRKDLRSQICCSVMAVVADVHTCSCNRGGGVGCV